MSNISPIPLFGSGIDSISKVITAQRRLNCFWDIRKDKDKSDAVLVGTPGLTLFITLPTYPIRGWRAIGNYFYVVAGSVLYKVGVTGSYSILDSTTITLGDLNKVSMHDNGTQLMIVDGHQGYILTLATDAFAVITDSNFPNGATTVTFLDGRFIVEKPNSRQAYASDSYDGFNWGDSGGFTVMFWTKESYSDDMFAVNSFSGFLIMFGVGSLEYWQDIGASPLPYARISGSTQRWGLAAKWSRAEVSNTIIFLGLNPEGHTKVCQIGSGGYEPTVISTSDIEDIINDMRIWSDAVALTYVIYGHVMYQLSFPTGGRTLLYDTSTGAWQEVQSGLDLQSRHRGDIGLSFNSQNYASDYENGKIYKFDEYSYTDESYSVRRQVTSRHIRDNGNPITPSQVYLDMETGVGLSSGQGNDPQITLEKSVDNGRTFGMPRMRSMGKIGEYKTPRIMWNRNGTAKDFVFRFTVTDPVKFVITGGGVAL